MSIARISVVPLDMEFPAGTVGGPWRIEVDGVARQEAPETVAQFTLTTGHYIAAAQRLSDVGLGLGPRVTMAFDVNTPAPATVTIQVVGDISVTLEAPNQAPVWNAAPLEFVDGVPSVVKLADRATDPDGDALIISLKTMAPELAAKGFTYDEPSDELRYDGHKLGATAAAPVVVENAIVVNADDGRA